MPSSRLFGPMLTTPEMAEAVSDRAWLQAMLDVEAALARAQAAVGLMPAEAAEAIAGACAADRFDVGAIGAGAASAASPVVPLVDALRAVVAPDVRGYVHRGATSQDIIDTAMMLVARAALDLILNDLRGVAEACARLADGHRETVMAGRTLMQQAVPITFGLKAAGWLTGAVEATTPLRRIRNEGLALQLGGAAGTLSAFGGKGLEVAEGVGKRLGLSVPAMPWHTERARVAETAAALAVAAGAMGKIALDVLLMAQTEVSEVSEGGSEGRGRSSAMPHKRNPVAAVTVRACAAQAQGFAATLLGTMAQEHERAAGTWQAEWPVLSALFEVTGGAAAKAAEMLETLQIHPQRMRANLDASRGLFATELLLSELRARMSDRDARQIVNALVEEARQSGRALLDLAGRDARVTAVLSVEELARICDPATHVGMADALVDRALAAFGDARTPAP